uniref:Ig-like domain-containing protein n=1 Tax=Pygocentrus nattereri TaxID=42514 RepID=A0AAR2JGW7_PYGNA
MSLDCGRKPENLEETHADTGRTCKLHTERTLVTLPGNRTQALLAVRQQLYPPPSHSLQYIYTAVTPGINFPEFTAVGLVDGEQIDYYDSEIRKMILKTEWMEKIDADDPDYWNRNTQNLQRAQDVFKVDVRALMQRFNQTDGVHTVQWMYGCELHDDGTRRGYMQYGYDGEDFISLDLNTETWTAANPKAVITKQKWEKTNEAKLRTAYLEHTCTEWLEKYVEYSRSTLKRKEKHSSLHVVSLFQNDSSSQVVCHATGFFPKAVMISWQKNGEDLHEDVELRETLPNQDGTFQKRSVLTVSPEELKKNKYTCVVQHSGLEREMKLQVSVCRVLSGRRKSF